jgi:AcrR family transcriptional regulator
MATVGESTAGRDDAGPRARKDLVSAQILDKAATIFADRGFQGTGIRDIADAMQMSRPAVYHYFSTKEALLEELVAGVTGEILRFIVEVRQAEGLDHREKLELLVTGLVERVAAKPAHMRLLAASERTLPEPIGSRHARGRRQALDEVQGLIAAGIAAGELRPVDERLAALAVLGMCNWVAWWFRPDGGVPVELIAREMSALVLNGLPRLDGRHLADGSIDEALRLVREDLSHLEALVAASERGASR